MRERNTGNKDYFERERERLYGSSDVDEPRFRRVPLPDIKPKHEHNTISKPRPWFSYIFDIVKVVFWIIVYLRNLILVILIPIIIYFGLGYIVKELQEDIEKDKIELKQRQFDAKMNESIQYIYTAEAWSKKVTRINFLLKNHKLNAECEQVVNAYYVKYVNEGRNSYDILDFLQISLYKDYLSDPDNFASLFKTKYWDRLKDNPRTHQNLISSFGGKDNILPRQIAKDYRIASLNF